MRKALYIMGILDDTDIEWLSHHGVNRFLDPGAVIITEGVPVDSLFIVLDGLLQVYSGNLEIAKLQSGEIVGEISFVDSRPPLASVKAIAKSNVLAVNAELLRTKLSKDPKFASRFYRAVAIFLADRLRVTTSRFGYGKADQDTFEREDPDELSEELLGSLDLATRRFDKLQRRFSTGTGG